MQSYAQRFAPARMLCAAVAVFGWAVAETPAGWQAPETAGRVGAARPRVWLLARGLLDAHNAYPTTGDASIASIARLRPGCRLPSNRTSCGDRPARAVRRGRSCHTGSRMTGRPSLREYFFERIRPIVEQALKSRRSRRLAARHAESRPQIERAGTSSRDLDAARRGRAVADHPLNGPPTAPAPRRSTSSRCRADGRSRYAGTMFHDAGTSWRKTTVVWGDSPASADRRRHEPRREPRQVSRGFAENRCPGRRTTAAG